LFGRREEGGEDFTVSGRKGLGNASEGSSTREEEKGPDKSEEKRKNCPRIVHQRDMEGF